MSSASKDIMFYSKKSDGCIAVMESCTQSNNEHDSFADRNKGKTLNQETVVSNRNKLLIYGSCLLQSFTISGFGFGLNVIYAELVQVFSNPRSEVALIQSLFLGLSDIGGIFWSYPVKKRGPGACVMVATVVGCAALFTSAFSKSLPLIIVLIGAIGGIAFGICTISPFIMTNSTFGKRKALFLAILTCASSLGQFVFTLSMDSLIQEYRWNGSIFIISAVMLNNFACGLIMHLCGPKRNKDNESVAQSSETLFRRDIFKDWRTWLLLAAGFILPATAGAEGRFYVDLLVLKGYTRETGALFASLIGIANLVGRVLGVATKLNDTFNSVEHAVYSCVINSGSHLMVIYLNSYWGLFFAAILNGLSLGLLVAHLPVLVLDIFGKDKYASAFAILSFISGIGFFVGGYSGGLIYDLLGTYDPLFYIAFGGNLIASFIFLILSISARNWPCFKCIKYERL